MINEPIAPSRRNEITALIFAVFAERPQARTHPVPYGRMVLLVQHCTDITRHEIDHVLVALCCRLVVNLIAGDVFFCGPPDLLVPYALADSARIDAVFGPAYDE